ncbi:MAG: hypothetical protein ACRCZO_05885, partial [Cetobacterium sp.]
TSQPTGLERPAANVLVPDTTGLLQRSCRICCFGAVLGTVLAGPTAYQTGSYNVLAHASIYI